MPEVTGESGDIDTSAGQNPTDERLDTQRRKWTDVPDDLPFYLRRSPIGYHVIDLAWFLRSGFQEK